MNATLPASTEIPTSIHSQVNACRLCGVVPERLQQLAELLGIEPAMRINSVPHFSEGDVQRMLTYLKASRQADATGSG